CPDGRAPVRASAGGAARGAGARGGREGGRPRGRARSGAGRRRRARHPGRVAGCDDRAPARSSRRPRARGAALGAPAPAARRRAGPARGRRARAARRLHRGDGGRARGRAARYAARPGGRDLRCGARGHAVSALLCDLGHYQTALRQHSPLRFQGRVAQVIGLSIEVEGLRLAVGDICTIHPEAEGPYFSAEVVGFRDDRLIVMPFSETHGIRPGSAVFPRGRGFNVPVGPTLLGRVLNGLAQPIDGRGPLGTTDVYPLVNRPPDPLTRQPIREPLSLGIRALDGLLTCGKGQRLGIFAGSGVGKSTTLGMIARNTQADVNVVALIGERGREVQEFIDRDLGPEGLARSVVVVSTSDQPALQRIKAAWIATAVAEYFRDQGLHVTLMMDSVTRWAMAQREIGLTV